MTNSAPNLDNKVERQNSPNTTGIDRHHHQYQHHQNHQHNRLSTIKPSMFLHNNSGGGRHTGRNTNNGRLSCSPHCSSTSKSTRNSPLRYEGSPRNSPTSNFYAGAKFSEPPSPASLPKPPSHWTIRLISTYQQTDRTCDISSHLKMVLNVQA